MKAICRNGRAITTTRARLVHPQFWPEDLDYSGKRIVIVGSGATAVTLAPALAEKAAQVTQLQRSPTYVVSRPSEDAFNTFLKIFLPAKLAYQATRWRTIITGRLRAKRFAKDPRRAKQMLIDLAKAQIGPRLRREAFHAGLLARAAAHLPRA